jgi:imidazolonepropionase-like amidohydrolase
MKIWGPGRAPIGQGQRRLSGDPLDRAGSVAPGYTADLLLLGTNPLADIRHTRRIRALQEFSDWE